MWPIDHVFPNGLPNFVVEDNIFASEFTEKMILYPTEVCMLSNMQFICLQSFLKMIGESMYIITDSFILDDSSSGRLNLDVFEADLDYSIIKLLYFNPVTVFCSVNATWGAVISDEEYAIIGCKRQHASCFASAFRCCKEQRQVFASEYAKREDLPNRYYNEKLVNKILSWVPEITY